MRTLVLKNIPTRVDNDKTLQLINSTHQPSEFFSLLKTLTNEDDKEISDWLNISLKTFKSYKTENKNTKRHLTEHAIMLLSLYKHGIQIYGTAQQFKNWLEGNNFYFDNKAPIKFMDTISGIKFIDDRLTAMEFGDTA